MDPFVSKAAVTAVAQVAPEAKGLLSRLLGPLFDEWGVSLREGAIARRHRNLERIAADAARRLSAANPLGLTRPTTDTRTVFALLEGASLEDEGSELEKSWSGLLASAAAGSPVPSSYPSILSQMAPNDATVLDSLGSSVGPRSVQGLGEASGIRETALLEAVDNLLRLRLCVINVPQSGEVIRRLHLALDLASELEMTTLGRNFLLACKGPAASPTA